MSYVKFHSYRRAKLCCAWFALLMAGSLLAGCAKSSLFVNQGQVEVPVGDQAAAKARYLAVAKGGPAEGIRSAKLETVALFESREMPTGLTLSDDGRVFLSFPRWGDAVPNTMLELKGGTLVPYPDPFVSEFSARSPDRFDPKSHLVSVQSVYADAKNRLWILDPGSVNFAPPIAGGPKLWAYDLETKRRVQEIPFPESVVGPASYLNDVRIAISRGQAGMAYITDSGAGGIVVVDLATGESWRKLDEDPSVKPAAGIVQTSEGEPFLVREPGQQEAPPKIASDGIALSPDGETLYYSPLVGRKIYSIPTKLLDDRAANQADVSGSVRVIAKKPSGNDGLICDAQGNLYSTDFEDNAIRKIDPQSGRSEVLIQDERLLWPDTLALHDGYLYLTSNQLARQPRFHFGKDERIPPYVLFRVKL